MRVLKALAFVVGAFVLLIVVFAVTESKEDRFENDARRLVEAQVGSDASVSGLTVHKLSNGQLSACGNVTRRVNALPGMSAPVTSPFYVGENGMVLIGDGDLSTFVYEAQANGCELKSAPPSG
jgi:hypothetical protein